MQTKFLPRLLPFLLATLWAGHANAQTTLTKTQPSPDQHAPTLAPVQIHGSQDKDEQGSDKVYDQNISTVYKSREELQRFEVTNPGDVFKGMNGVYSMDTRSSQAITPNIRGITGEGRTPLTIDGTEQSTNVWLHMFGAGNRSYADPALFRSIEVEKGPSLSRSSKSGVGGSVNIRTIDAADIIAQGNHWGIETNLKSSGNTSKPGFDGSSYYGQDYRNIPGAERNNITDISLPSPPPQARSNSKRFNFQDHSEMLAIAARNEVSDILLARSERKTGNYHAGKRHADKYTGHDVWDESSTDRYIPNLTKLYFPGNEVFNTASETKTTLLKNNWYLPNQQQIGLQYMRTDSTFGETTPGISVLMWAYREGAEQAMPDHDWKNERQFVFERPHSALRTDSYKLSYDIKPVDSKWLNLETSLWHTKLNGTRYQTGVSPYGIDIDKATYDALFVHDSMVSQFPEFSDMFTPPEHDGTIVADGRQWTNHKRTGFDFSNQARLTDNLHLTVAGSYQQEKLDDRVQQSNKASNGLLPDGVSLHAGTDRLGPRSGKRKEYSATMNLSWQATDWLTLTAGTRYLHYTGKDTGTAARRRQQEEFFKAARQRTGLELTYNTVMSLTDRARLAELDDKRWNAIEIGPQDGSLPGSYWYYDKEIDSIIAGRKTTTDRNTGVNYWVNTVVVPYVNGKPDASKNPFTNGELDVNAEIENPYGQGYIKAVTPGDTFGRAIYEYIDQGNAWEMPEEQSGDAISPVFSATAKLSPYGTAFARFAQTTRFPSLQELSSSAITDGAGTVGTWAVNGASKPERSTNWEIGYAHDLTQFLPTLHLADVRLSYYNTQIKNFIDRNIYFDTIQFNKKKTSGIELQSRFDSGRFFGSVAASYRLTQKLCDQDYAAGMDPYFNRIPACMTGGFPGTYSGASLQPKYSIDMALGTRLLKNRLELGWRGTYHAGANNKQLDRLLSSNDGAALTSALPRRIWFREGQDTFYWRSVLLHDIYANFHVSKQVKLNLGVSNLLDEYYLDPMSKTLLPAPGRTITAGLQIKF